MMIRKSAASWLFLPENETTTRVAGLEGSITPKKLAKFMKTVLAGVLPQHRW
jgi:hypothetical protein